MFCNYQDTRALLIHTDYAGSPDSPEGMNSDTAFILVFFMFRFRFRYQDARCVEQDSGRDCFAAASGTIYALGTCTHTYKVLKFVHG
jgi:hypothetical protein